ncbi:glycosyltransferase family 39 protein [Candidatus Saccharibacteria bacterium]|nr:glycosyltransferase family 39 protein [Candidatus Saccharibacteria bacterium]
MVNTILNKILIIFKTQWKIIFIVALVLIASSSIKLFAATQLGYLGDEPDDFANLNLDIEKTRNFYNGIISAEQSRLSHFVTAPIVYFAGNKYLFLSRVVSILAFNAFLVTVYLLLRLHLNRTRSLFGLITIASSCYLFSYSFLAMTSSGSVYLFLSTLSVYVYLRQIKNGVSKKSTHIALLGVIFGLAMSAKLFGILLLAATAFYDFMLQKQWKNPLSKSDITKVVQSHQFKAVFLFYFFWICINIVPISSALKLSMFVVLIPLIIGYFIYSAALERYSLNSFVRWLHIAIVAGMILIVTSPIYLNVKNVVKIFNWSDEWNSVNIIINPSIYDPFTTISVKYGLVAGILLIVSILFLAYKKRLSQLFSDYGLIFIILGVFLLIFMVVNNYFAWYPLVIFWILYIPFCYVFPEKITLNPKIITLALLLLLIPANEVYRYIKLFPNGQTDGAQYGEQYVGWNKPGFITFEALPLLKEYVSNSGYFPSELTVVDCALIPDHLERYNRYVIETINYYLQREEVYNFRCSENKVKSDYKYVMISNYTSKSFTSDLMVNYKVDKQFYVNSVNVATIWVRNE